MHIGVHHIVYILNSLFCILCYLSIRIFIY
nr:MAG TPA: hypothetical protein [Caudoviricetes sp.]